MVNVSIVIPIYNAQDFLKDSLHCLINQTLKEIEIICVDDGSTDNTGLILQEYACKDKRIKIITQENQGAGMARNRGLKEAAGEYLAFLDCDDIYESTMLEKMYKAAKGKDLDVIVCRSDKFNQITGRVIKCDWTIHDKLLPKTDVFAATDVEKDFFMTFVWWPWDKLYRREFILEQGLEYQNLRTTNDLFFVVCSVMAAKKVSWVEEVLIHHRIGEKSSLSVTREKSWGNFHEALVAVKKFMLEKNLYQRFELDYLNYCAHFSLWHLQTIWGRSFVLLYNKLKDEWFEEFGLRNADQTIYYNKANYYMVNYILRSGVCGNKIIGSNKVYQAFKKLRLFCVGNGIKKTIIKIKEKVPEYI